MIRGKLNVVIDGQWGSTGKGKLAAYLAINEDVDVSICDFQNNAGHTVVMDDDNKIVFQQLPVAAVNPKTLLLVSPAATIELEKLEHEIRMMGIQPGRLFIDPRATIIKPEHREYERDNLRRISSTLKGCGAATGWKAMRHPGVVLARDIPYLASFIGDTAAILDKQLRSGAMCMMESAQGFDLSLNYGYDYPYVTSRDVTTASCLNNAGVQPHFLGDVYGSIRTFPIRVGHEYDLDGKKLGDSGPFYSDMKELSWGDISIQSKSMDTISERTTVTNKLRRVFTFSGLQYEKFLKMCGPTKIFVNFVNYLDYNDYKVRSLNEVSNSTWRFVQRLREICRNYWHPGLPYPEIKYLGTGPSMSDMVIVHNKRLIS